MKPGQPCGIRGLLQLARRAKSRLSASVIVAGDGEGWRNARSAGNISADQLLIWRQVRSVFFVTFTPCALSHFLCSACALVNAAVLGKLAGLRFGVDILITRDIRLVPRSAGSLTEI